VDNPSLVNSDPTGSAWFFKMRVEDVSIIDDMMDEDEYADLIG
jgi:glycine cleavage system H protein